MPISPSPPPDSAFCHKPVPQAPDQFTALFSALTVVIFRLGGENFPRGLLPAARTSFSTAPSSVVATKKPPTPPGRGEDADPLENRSVLPPSPPHSNAQAPSRPIARSASGKMKSASLLGHRDASRRAIKRKPQLVELQQILHSGRECFSEEERSRGIVFAQSQSSGAALAIFGKTAKPEELDLNRATSAPLWVSEAESLLLLVAHIAVGALLKPSLMKCRAEHRSK